jgi:hypothetical protein
MAIAEGEPQPAVSIGLPEWEAAQKRARRKYLVARLLAASAVLVPIALTGTEVTLHTLPLPAGMHRSEPNFFPPDSTPDLQPKHTLELPGDPAVAWFPIGKHSAYLIGIPADEAATMAKDGCTTPVMGFEESNGVEEARFINGWSEFQSIDVNGISYRALAKTVDGNTNQIALGCINLGDGSVTWASDPRLLGTAESFASLQENGVTTVM